MQDAALGAAQHIEYEEPGIAKRPAPIGDDTNPAAKKRARRLFGALMGTLAKARCGSCALYVLAIWLDTIAGWLHDT
jgi:hypothetical protein